MARIRNIKPAFFKDTDLFDAEAETGLPLRVAYAGLWTVADRKGIFKWKPRALKTDVLPYDDVDMDAVLAGLVKCRKIFRYKAAGEEYGFIKNFEKHQFINKNEAASTNPEPTENSNDYSATSSGSTSHCETFSASDTDADDQVKMPDKSGQSLPAPKPEGKKKPYPEDFEVFWKAYPTDPNMPKKPAFRQWQRLSPEQRFAAIAAIPGFIRYCSENKRWYRPIYAERFLSQEKFEGYAAEPPLDEAVIAANKDRADKLFNRGKYAEKLA